MSVQSVITAFSDEGERLPAPKDGEIDRGRQVKGYRLEIDRIRRGLELGKKEPTPEELDANKLYGRSALDAIILANMLAKYLGDPDQPYDDA